MTALLTIGAAVGGASVGLILGGCLAAAKRADELTQLPTLGQGTWLVCVDRHGEMTRCEPHQCFADAFERLEQAMRKDEA